MGFFLAVNNGLTFSFVARKEGLIICFIYTDIHKQLIKTRLYCKHYGLSHVLIMRWLFVLLDKFDIASLQVINTHKNAPKVCSQLLCSSVEEQGLLLKPVGPVSCPFCHQSLWLCRSERLAV